MAITNRKPPSGSTHGDGEQSTQGPPCNCRQPVPGCMASCPRAWQAVLSDVVDREWSTHNYREILPHQIQNQQSQSFGWTLEQVTRDLSSSFHFPGDQEQLSCGITNDVMRCPTGSITTMKNSYGQSCLLDNFCHLFSMWIKKFQSSGQSKVLKSIFFLSEPKQTQQSPTFILK